MIGIISNYDNSQIHYKNGHFAFAWTNQTTTQYSLAFVEFLSEPLQSLNNKSTRNKLPKNKAESHLLEII